MYNQIKKIARYAAFAATMTSPFVYLGCGAEKPTPEQEAAQVQQEVQETVAECNRHCEDIDELIDEAEQETDRLRLENKVLLEKIKNE